MKNRGIAIVFVLLVLALFYPTLRTPTGLQSAPVFQNVTFLAYAGQPFQTTLEVSLKNATLNDTTYAHLNGTLLLFNPPENSSEYQLLAITPEQLEEAIR